MLLHIKNVLTAEQVSQARHLLAGAEWIDGRVTAGVMSAKTKDNMQVPEEHPAAQKIGETILAALGRNGIFISAALPLKIYPPLFNRYSGGQNFGFHVDNAVRAVTGTPYRVRTDLSATLFLSAPADYDGGELVIEDTYGAHRVKLPAGDMILYPASSLHQVQPVTRGERVASFFWIQSMVRDDAQRTLLLELDTSIQQIARTLPDNPVSLQLTNIYHNLLRRWSDA